MAFEFEALICTPVDRNYCGTSITMLVCVGERGVGSEEISRVDGGVGGSRAVCVTLCSQTLARFATTGYMATMRMDSDMLACCVGAFGRRSMVALIDGGGGRRK